MFCIKLFVLEDVNKNYSKYNLNYVVVYIKNYLWSLKKRITWVRLDSCLIQLKFQRFVLLYEFFINLLLLLQL